MSNPRPDFLSPDGPRLVFFGGKGGTGKTTLATAAACFLAQQPQHNGRILLISTDPAHSVRDALADQPLPDHLDVVELDADAAYQAFLEKNRDQLVRIAARGTMLNEEEVQRFLLPQLPGAAELMAFLAIADRLTDGSIERIIVDTAPTGHALRLLASGDLLNTWVEVFRELSEKHHAVANALGGTPAREAADDFIDQLEQQTRVLVEALHNSARAVFIPVCRPETLYLRETEHLLDELDAHTIESPQGIINLAEPHALTADLAELIEGYTTQWFLLPPLPREPRGAEQLTSLWDRLTPLDPEALQPDTNAPPPSIRIDNPAPAPEATFLFFAGKGGVGKTTLAAATACALADANTPVLLVSTDPAHSLGHRLAASISNRPAELAPNLLAVEIAAEQEFEQLRHLYRQTVQGSLASDDDNAAGGFRIAYEHDALARLADLTPPGIDELMALVRISELAEQHPEHRVIVDTAPTGHLLSLVRSPRLLEAWISAFLETILQLPGAGDTTRLQARLVRIGRGTRKLRQHLHDPARTRFIIPAIPTTLSIEETRDLVAALRDEQLAVDRILLNEAGPAFNVDDHALSQLRRAAHDVPITTIRRLETPELDRDALTRLGRAIYALTNAQRQAA